MYVSHTPTKVQCKQLGIATIYTLKLYSIKGCSYRQVKHTVHPSFGCQACKLSSYISTWGQYHVYILIYCFVTQDEVSHPKVVIVEECLFCSKPRIGMVGLLFEQLQLVCLCEFVSPLFPRCSQCSSQLLQVCQTRCQVLLGASRWQTHPKLLERLERLLSAVNLSLAKMDLCVMNVTAELTPVQYQTDGERGNFDVTGCVSTTNIQ